MNPFRRLQARFRGRSLVVDSAWGLLQEGLNLIGTITSFALLGRALGPAGYGGYASVFATIAPLVTLAASGVMLALMDHAVRRQEPLDATSRASLTLSLVLGTGLSLVGTIVVINIVHTVPVAAIIIITVTEFVISPLIQLAASTVQSGGSYASSARIRMAVVICKILVVTGLFALDKLQLTTFVLANGAVQLLIGMVALRHVGKIFGFRFVPGRFSWQLMKTNMAYSVSISAFSVQNDGDKSVMAANRLTIDTGLYSAAYRIVQMGLLPLGAFMSATHARLLEQVGTRRHHLNLAVRYTRILGAYSLVFTTGLLVAAPLISVVIGKSFEGSVNMTRWLAPLVLLRSLSAAPMNGLLGLGRVMFRAGLIVTLAALSLTAYIVLIPRMGWRGAAIGTVAGELLTVVAAWVALVVFQNRHDRDVPGDAQPAAALATS